MSKEDGSTDAKMCPWCGRWCLKDAACDYIFACGLDTRDGFIMGAGELEKRTDLEKETIADVRRILQEEFDKGE